ncbi:MAG TPA: RluA family pseudouridine synthase [Candidatus Binatia bacterium]|nr:RluA family pseudouridine synthase [Candidatus Binatia bacterium]
MPGVERLEVPPAEAGERLDRFLARQFPTLSRTRLAALIHQGQVRIAGAAAKPARRVAPGEWVEIEVTPRAQIGARPVELPLEILYEDEDVVVVNKPAGLVVHPGAGTRAEEATLAGALVHRYGRLSAQGGGERPGIVHRLDKGTSGVLVVARNDAAHRGLAAQFAARSLEKTYLALVHGKLKSAAGSIRLAVARDLRRRTRMTTRRRPGAGRASQTDWRALAVIGNFTLVEVALRTGRTHQIRVHFSALGHPVAGDTLYGAPKNPGVSGAAMAPLGRPFLHAARLAFAHPRSGSRVEARAPLPAELRRYLEAVAGAAGVPVAEIDAALRGYL